MKSLSDAGRSQQREATDRILHQILSAIADRQKNKPMVCFKGGTLLRACWKEDYRYSEDLDFDWLDESSGDKESIRLFFDKVLKRAHKAHGTEFGTDWSGQNLNIEWATKAEDGKIRVDVRHRDFPVAPPTTQMWKIINRYRQTSTTPLLGYSLESMLASKFECVLAPKRVAPRDYYDLRELLTSPEIDLSAAITEFVGRSAHDNPAHANPLTVDWINQIFDATHNKLSALERKWKFINADGLIPPPFVEFAELVDDILDGLNQEQQPVHPGERASPQRHPLIPTLPDHICPDTDAPSNEDSLANPTETNLRRRNAKSASPLHPPQRPQTAPQPKIAFPTRKTPQPFHRPSRQERADRAGS